MGTGPTEAADEGSANASTIKITAAIRSVFMFVAPLSRNVSRALGDRWQEAAENGRIRRPRAIWIDDVVGGSCRPGELGFVAGAAGQRRRRCLDRIVSDSPGDRAAQERSSRYA